MDTDDILKKLDGDEFTIRPVDIQVMLLRYLIRVEINQSSILKRQIKIIEMLNGKTGQELEETVSELSAEVFEKNSDVSSKEFLEQIRSMVS
ncbi:MAG: hypothetical protein IE931_03020 [Sphingobacteriales bacterium]|nr:hypothetical protein [Sphingobacteriales bacterium]